MESIAPFEVGQLVVYVGPICPFAPDGIGDTSSVWTAYIPKKGEKFTIRTLFQDNVWTSNGTITAWGVLLNEIHNPSNPLTNFEYGYYAKSFRSIEEIMDQEKIKESISLSPEVTVQVVY